MLGKLLLRCFIATWVAMFIVINFVIIGTYNNERERMKNFSNNKIETNIKNINYDKNQGEIEIKIHSIKNGLSTFAVKFDKDSMIIKDIK